MTVGLLYEVQQPSLVERLSAQKVTSLRGGAAPTTQDVIKSFYPAF